MPEPRPVIESVVARWLVASNRFAWRAEKEESFLDNLIPLLERIGNELTDEEIEEGALRLIEDGEEEFTPSALRREALEVRRMNEELTDAHTSKLPPDPIVTGAERLANMEKLKAILKGGQA